MFDIRYCTQIPAGRAGFFSFDLARLQAIFHSCSTSRLWRSLAKMSAMITSIGWFTQLLPVD